MHEKDAVSRFPAGTHTGHHGLFPDPGDARKSDGFPSGLCDMDEKYYMQYSIWDAMYIFFIVIGPGRTCNLFITSVQFFVKHLQIYAVIKSEGAEVKVNS